MFILPLRKEGGNSENGVYMSIYVLLYPPVIEVFL